MKELLIDDFLKTMKGEWQEGFKLKYRPLLEELLQLIDTDSKEGDIEGFFLYRNRFVCERFLRYILKYGKLKKEEKKNAKKLLSFLSSQEIISRDYDERIEALGVNHAIKAYWEPEDEVNKRRIEIISDAIGAKKGEVVIDVGCGVGTFTYRAALKGAKAIGVDYSLQSLRIAKSLSEKRLRNNAWIGFVVADATSLPFKDSSADVIVSADFIEHIDDSQKERFLDESVRLLRRDGRMVVFTPNKIREYIGAVVRWLKGGEGTRLHLGLITRFSFEKKLMKRGLRYRRRFVDVVRPYLATLPFLRELLSLEILWVIKR
jgi:SAM-dependent methyltransferase